MVVGCWWLVVDGVYLVSGLWLGLMVVGSWWLMVFGGWLLVDGS